MKYIFLPLLKLIGYIGTHTFALVMFTVVLLWTASWRKAMTEARLPVTNAELDTNCLVSFVGWFIIFQGYMVYKLIN